MIYLIGFQQDIVVSFVRHAVRQGLIDEPELRVVAMEEIIQVSLDFDSLLCLRIETQSGWLELGAQDRIYLRPYAFEEAARLALAPADELRVFEQNYQTLLLCRQVALGNTSLRSESNNNKILHSRLFNDLIPTPLWRATNQALAAEETLDHIVKSPSYVRTQVVRVGDFPKSNQMPPILVQQEVVGVPVRVTVIGFKDIAAAAILRSQGIDYRYAEGDAAHIQRMELPSETRELVLMTARRYGLPLCGLDLMLATEGWHFLEVNPEPGWAFLPEAQNLEILRHILRFLKTSPLPDFLLPDLSLSHDVGLSAKIASDHEVHFQSYPSELRPTDYVARPGEEHPFWVSR